jgi:hypothetical protein
MGEIQTALARRGVQRISTLFDDDGTPAGLGFTMKTDYGVREFELPVRTDGVLSDEAGYEGAEGEADRRAGRPRRLADREGLARGAVGADRRGLASLDEVMLPYMLVAPDRTVYVDMRQRLLAIEGGSG